MHLQQATCDALGVTLSTLSTPTSSLPTLTSFLELVLSAELLEFLGVALALPMLGNAKWRGSCCSLEGVGAAAHPEKTNDDDGGVCEREHVFMMAVSDPNIGEWCAKQTGCFTLTK
jgi:hypothetical protein